MAETPHYSMVIFDQWLGAFLIAKNAGAADSGSLYDTRMRKAMEWFGNISTPRDPQNNRLRRWPTVGHTYRNERSSTFGVMACLWKDRDPQFAAEMEWMHREHGSFGQPGILSYYPALMGYRSFFHGSGVTPRKPNWTSQYYQETGVQLRNVIGSDRETTLYLIAGRLHSHYFNDSGSITIWGKGSELCDDDDYQNRRNPQSREAHSMPDRPATFNEERVMELREFSTSPDLDYVSGVRLGWQRQIAFVKDADPLGPNYFVIADTLDEKSSPTFWRLFLRGNKITPTASGVTLTGKEDVDLDLFFLQKDVAKPQILGNRIAVAVEKSGTLTVILYPRLRTEPRPKVKALADGQGAEITTAAGTDIVYLSPTPLKADLGGQEFEGKVALLKTRKGKPVRALPGACEIKRDWWTEGDPQLRQIHWSVGPQYPKFPDYDEAVEPNPGNSLVLNGRQPASASAFTVAKSGAAPRQTTTVAVNWDKKALDILFTCADRDLVGVEQGVDNIKLWRDDSVYVWLDPGHTHDRGSKGFMIQASLSGAWHDIRNGEAAFNVKGLKTEVSRRGNGWKARLQVPWKGLGVKAPKAGDVWGVNFSRMDQPGKLDHRNMQASSWVPIPLWSDLPQQDRWGHLLFTGKKDADAQAARNAMEKTHETVIRNAYSRERLLGNP